MVHRSIKESMSLPSKLLKPKSMEVLGVDSSQIAAGTISQARLDYGSIIAPKLSAKEIVEGGTLSGSFDYAGAVTGKSQHLELQPSKWKKPVGGFPNMTQKGKSYEEHFTQQAIDKAAVAFNDLHQVIGKAHPHKAPKTQSAMALLSKKAPSSN